MARQVHINEQLWGCGRKQKDGAVKRLWCHLSKATFKHFSVCCHFFYPAWIFPSLCGSKSFCLLPIQWGELNRMLSFPQPCFGLLQFSNSRGESANLKWQRSMRQNFWQILDVRIMEKVKGGSWRKDKVLWTWKEQVKSTSRDERGTKQDAETGKTRNYFRHEITNHLWPYRYISVQNS